MFDRIAIRFVLAPDEEGALAFASSPLLETRAQPARARRAAAPRAPARLGAGDAPAAGAAPPRDRGALVPLPLHAPELRAPVGERGRRRLRGRARRAPAAADGRRRVRAPAADLRPRREGSLAASAPRRPGGSKDRARRTPGSRGATRTVRRRSSSTIPPGSSSASPASSRTTGKRRSSRSGRGSSPCLPTQSSQAGRRIAGGGLYGFLAGLAPALRVEPAEHRFGLDIPHDHTVSALRAEPARPRPERLRLAARPRELRRAVATDAHLPRTAPR